jgi:hypothetical protein
MFLDFAFAILTSILTNAFFDIPLTSVIYFTLFFSILPDLDFKIDEYAQEGLTFA